ncbi:unnamed protein product, partial [Ectocarpus sp. 12 AP-2014]
GLRRQRKVVASRAGPGAKPAVRARQGQSYRAPRGATAAEAAAEVQGGREEGQGRGLPDQRGQPPGGVPLGARLLRHRGHRRKAFPGSCATHQQRDRLRDR